MIFSQKNKQELNWQKNFDLIPVIIQHIISGEVLMLGYMNNQALEITKKSGYVTFFSRKKQCIWIKGENSGNYLKVINFYPDCDNDALLFLVIPHGPTCHYNNSSCFYPAIHNLAFLYKLENIINVRIFSDPKISYTASLYNEGIKRIAQKVGEEGLEISIAAILENKEELINEIADFIYHLLVLLKKQKIDLNEIINKLNSRHY